MRRSLKVTGIVAASLTGLALLAGPALAQAGFGPGNFGPGNCPGTAATGGTGQMMGNGWSGPMMGNWGNAGPGGMMGNGFAGGRGGMMGGLAAQGTMTDAQKTTLASLAEEEKLAHDVYVALASKYPSDYQFAHISRSETMHQSALYLLMTRYDVTDPTAGLAEGDFASARYQELYEDLLAKATNATSALAVGVEIEKADIADLTAALDGLTAPDAQQVYTNLRFASQHHLAAFGG